MVANLQKQQQADQHEVVIVTSNCDEIAAGRHIYKVGLKDTPAGLDTITPRRIISLLALFFCMFVILRRERPDVIHVHSVDMAFSVSFAARWYGIPIVHTFHIVTFYGDDQSALRRKSELWLAKKAHLRAVTAPNSYDVNKLRRVGLRQTTLLPNGVDLAAWDTSGYTEKNREFTFLAFGRLERQKGYEYLLRAAAMLAQTQPTTFRVIVAGEGSLKVSLEELARKLDVGDTVEFVGRKTQEEIRMLLSRTHAVVFPSLYETTPLTLLEAWAAEVPVIATSVGILREAAANFGAASIVPPKDEHKLMFAMRGCMENEMLRSQLARQGLSEAKKYTWPIIAQIAEKIYRGAQ